MSCSSAREFSAKHHGGVDPDSVGRGKFKAFSAGSHPTGIVNSLALKLIEQNGLPTEGLRSKDWNEFAKPGAPFRKGGCPPSRTRYLRRMRAIDIVVNLYTEREAGENSLGIDPADETR